MASKCRKLVGAHSHKSHFSNLYVCQEFDFKFTPPCRYSFEKTNPRRIVTCLATAPSTVKQLTMADGCLPQFGHSRHPRLRFYQDILRTLRGDHVLHFGHDFLEGVRLIVPFVLQTRRFKPIIPNLVLFRVEAIDQFLQTRVRYRGQHRFSILVHPPQPFVRILLHNLERSPPLICDPNIRVFWTAKMFHLNVSRNGFARNRRQDRSNLRVRQRFLSPIRNNVDRHVILHIRTRISTFVQSCLEFCDFITKLFVIGAQSFIVRLKCGTFLQCIVASGLKSLNRKFFTRFLMSCYLICSIISTNTCHFPLHQ